MYSLIKREGQADTRLCRCDTEAQCRSRLEEILPRLTDKETVLIVRVDHGLELEVLGTFMRPPYLDRPTSGQ